MRQNLSLLSAPVQPSSFSPTQNPIAHIVIKSKSWSSPSKALEKSLHFLAMFFETVKSSHVQDLVLWKLSRLFFNNKFSCDVWDGSPKLACRLFEFQFYKIKISFDAINSWFVSGSKNVQVSYPQTWNKVLAHLCSMFIHRPDGGDSVRSWVFMSPNVQKPVTYPNVNVGLISHVYMASASWFFNRLLYITIWRIFFCSLVWCTALDFPGDRSAWRLILSLLSFLIHFRTADFLKASKLWPNFDGFRSTFMSKKRL